MGGAVALLSVSLCLFVCVYICNRVHVSMRAAAYNAITAELARTKEEFAEYERRDIKYQVCPAFRLSKTPH